jgi:hypothetical protein
VSGDDRRESAVAVGHAAGGMIDAGFFARRVPPRPEWLRAEAVREICSVSTCVSEGAPGWIERWRHNGCGWFNTIADARHVIPAGEFDAYRLFGYRVYHQQFADGGRFAAALPDDVRPDAVPAHFRSLGFDAASRTAADVLGFECSPLSCNGMAAEIPTNEHCLLPTLDQAIAVAERFSREYPEPGDYFVIEVLEGP